ncbi:MAG: aminotransferase class I/II-fold pyridoxal phosphate-dependent enzyme [Robiginitalea sp.]|jgi:7-keto-8-aminopelargonate synthetase-like enzyme
MSFRSEAIPGTEILKEGTTYLYFGGTSYLGMQRDPEFLEIMSGCIRNFGTHWGASRVGNVKLPVYTSGEAALASWIGSPSCLTLSSGFLAARLLAEYFIGQGYCCLFSPNCHEALLPPGSVRQPDWGSLVRALQDHQRSMGNTLPVVFSDSIGGPNKPGPVWDLLGKLNRDCILVVDDSHGLGISGPDGSGSWKPLKAMGFRELLLCGSLGKAMGITAGMVAGATARLEELRKTPFFAGASPAPPAGISSLVKALEKGLYQEKFKQLRAGIAFLHGRVAELDFLTCREAYPVVGFRDRELVRHLLSNRILITDFEYPAEGETASHSRIVVTAAHGEPQLHYLTEVLKAFKNY